MSTLEQTITDHKKLVAIQEDPQAQAREQRAMRTLPPEMATAVAQLMLLYGVPFEHLVPDWRMLPPNAIRFFYFDANWLDSLLDGAFSVGIHSERDTGHQRTLNPLIRLLAEQAAPELRPTFQEGVRLGEFTAVNVESDGAAPVQPGELQWSGFLMRSPAVSGWPGLEVLGFSGTEEKKGDELDLLRLERLAPDIMLCIFAGIPQLVVLREPAEGLHFGISQPGDRVKVRDPESGELSEEEVSVGVPFRQAADRVLNVKELHEALARKVSPADQSFGPADFALQMISTASKQRFKRA